MALEQIAEATKIRVHYLRAIEEGHYEKLPGGVYNVSYIRQYAQAISCEAAPLVQEYLARCEPEPIAPQPEVRRRIFGRPLLHSLKLV
jgi:cytoskeletal protein RodZ